MNLSYDDPAIERAAKALYLTGLLAAVRPTSQPFIKATLSDWHWDTDPRRGDYIEAVRAALAQQAQPDHHLRRNPHNNQDWCGSCNSYSCQAQQAQPLTLDAIVERMGKDERFEHLWHILWERDDKARDVARAVLEIAQQAQPKMPTREQVATVLCGFREDEAYPAADAVLALFAKETTP